jgi:hypothetical protein
VGSRRQTANDSRREQHDRHQPRFAEDAIRHHEGLRSDRPSWLRPRLRTRFILRCRRIPLTSCAARKLHFELFELNQAVFFDTNPIPIKDMRKRLGILERNEHRLPMVPGDARARKAPRRRARSQGCSRLDRAPSGSRPRSQSGKRRIGKVALSRTPLARHVTRFGKDIK